MTWGPQVAGNPTYSEGYGYTSAGQVTVKTLSVAKSGGTASLTGSFAYDTEGKPTTITYPSGTLQSYSYDAMSRLTGIGSTESMGSFGPCSPAAPATSTVNWATGGRYNAAGQLTDLQLMGSVTETCTGFSINSFNEHWQYNTLNQLTEIDTSTQTGGYPQFLPNPGPANTFFARYHFSATQNNGQAQSVDDARQSGANIAYTYDGLKRLTQATAPSWTQTIAYDGFGNITAKSVPPGSAEPAFPGAVSAKNWLTGVSYDANGNALAVNAFALTYDAENRLATATSGSAVESYFYDESNHRVEKTFGSSDFLYFYGPSGQLLSIRSVTPTGAMSMVADRVYFGAMLIGSAGQYGQSDVSTLTDRLGTAVTGYPYGTQKGNPQGNDQPDFATYTKDGTTGFEYAMNRYYSPGLGRFLTIDRIEARNAVVLPANWNKYLYVGGDPLNKQDPMGTCSPQDDPPCYSADGYGSPDLGFGGGEGGQSGPGKNVFEPPSGWDALSVDCQNALEEALPARSLASGYGPWLRALARANAQKSILMQATQGTGVDWRTLAAIGVRETGFLNLNEKDGSGVGVGVFQFTVNGTSGITAAQASDLTFAATAAVQMLTSNAAIISAAEPKISSALLSAAVLSSWNTGAQGQINRLNAGQSPDFHTAPTGIGPNRTYRNDYGANLFGLSDCFN